MIGDRADGHCSSDRGQVMLLVIGFTLILIALVTVVVDASRLFLHRRALAGAADGAVIAAVQAVDNAAIYAGSGALDSGELPLDQASAWAAVEMYVADSGLVERFNDFRIEGVEVGPDGSTVEVAFVATVELPFTGLVSSRYAHGVSITVVASGHAPLG